MEAAKRHQDTGGQGSPAFNTTEWTMVMVAGDSASPGAAEALERLCRTYWPPVYAFIRREGKSPDDARDLTQEFFAQFLAKRRVKLADPGRGRFRTFLIASLKNCLTNEWRAENAQKRGGGLVLISLDEQLEAETRIIAEPADPAITPDRAFEKRWALTLLESALGRLREEVPTTSEREHFDRLKVFVWGDPGSASQVDVAAELGITPNALGVAVHRLRRRFGELVRAEIARTVASPAEIDDELQQIVKILGS